MEMPIEKLRKVAHHVGMVENAVVNGSTIPDESLKVIVAFRHDVINASPGHRRDAGKIKELVVDIMRDFSTGAPVTIEWDRVVDDDRKIHVYGWIDRGAKPRDFVIMEVKISTLSYSVLTSSVKLSMHLNEVHASNDKRYQCIPFDDFFAGVSTEGIPVRRVHPCGNCAGRNHPLGEYCGGCEKKELRRNFRG